MARKANDPNTYYVACRTLKDDTQETAAFRVYWRGTVQHYTREKLLELLNDDERLVTITPDGHEGALVKKVNDKDPYPRTEANETTLDNLNDLETCTAFDFNRKLQSP